MVFVLTERDNTVEPQLLEKTTKVHTVYTRSLLNMQYSLCWAEKEEVKMDQAAAAKALAYTIYIPVLDFFKRYFRVARARRRDIIQQLFIHLPCLEDLWVVSRRNSHIIDIWYICLNPAWTTKYQKKWIMNTFLWLYKYYAS